jgi:mannosidase alpha-like ER degradation enhancer 3
MTTATAVCTGIPYSRINLRHGADRLVRSNDVTCTACAGTIIMEFAALSRYTGNAAYEVRE